MEGVGELVQRTRDDRTGQVLGSQAIERSGGAMCGLHRARGDEEHGCDIPPLSRDGQS
jgi:hypothetical protein